MRYSSNQHTQIDQEWDKLREELSAMQIVFRDIAPHLTQEKAREHIICGAARRLMIITRCIKNIFSIFPVRRTDRLNNDEGNDIEINLHAFLINVYALPDNLAWAFLLERQISMDPRDVGLFQKKTKLHLPFEIRQYLEGISNWQQKYAKNYRDALAHRIPPYIPPAALTPKHEQDLKDLHEQAEQALRKNDFEQALELRTQTHQIGIATPVFLHSFLDDTACGPMFLHPELIVDTKTILQIIHMVHPHLPVTTSQETG